METLEVNYRSIFETFPGRHALLLPDSPVFTILSISDAYVSHVKQPREECEGQGIMKLISGAYGPKYEGFARRIRASLDTVLRTKASQTVHLQLPGKSELEQIEHKPVLSDDGEVIYITQTLTAVSGREGGRPRQAASDFQHVIMQAPVAIGILRGRDFLLETANPSMLELWGKSEGIIGLPIEVSIPEIRDQQFPALLKKVFNTGEGYHGIETPAMLFKNGSWKKCYFNFVYSPIKEQGVTKGIMMVASDVTSIVESRNKVEESEKKYRDLIANATVATAVYLGQEQKIFLANESMLKLWGKDASVVGRPLREALPELAGQPFVNLLDHVYRTGETYYSAEDRADLVIDGRLQSSYFNFTYKALRDPDGTVYGILNMAVDVTASVKAKMKIKEAEERWRIALDSAELGTWDYYPGTGQFYCSSRTKELFGLPPESEPTFEEMLAAIDDHDRQRVRVEISRPLRDKRYRNYFVEYQVRGARDKLLRWQRTSGQAFFNENGEPYRLTGTVFDITERKKVEEALEERVQMRTRELLEANKELERSNHELEQYAYVASHDLQEPLRKILVYTDLIQQNARRQGKPEQPRLGKIMASAVRMSHLIQDLLNFSRLLKDENIFTRVRLDEVIASVIEDLELKINETGARIHVDPMPAIEGSEQQITQLFYNLINNALKFRKPGVNPDIRISVTPITEALLSGYPELSQRLYYFDITISDNGIGFHSKYARQIFEIFKRLHSRSRYEGTGIGLALCRKIARNHRGDIFAESEEGRGAAFHVLLPQSQLPR